MFSSLWLGTGLGPVPSHGALEFGVYFYLLGQSRDTEPLATFYGLRLDTGLGPVSSLL